MRRIEESSNSYFVGVNIGINDILEFNAPKFKKLVSFVFIRISFLDSSFFSGIISVNRLDVSN